MNKRILKISLAILAGLALIILVGDVAINRRILSSSRPYLYQETADAPSAQAALVLGALVYRSGRLSDVFNDRVLTAAELYRSHQVEKVLVSGDNSRVEYNEVEAAKTVLLQQGVPENDIVLDYAGFDTYDSMYRARDIFKARSLIVVTQNFHLPRAVYIGRELGMETYGVSADRQNYLKAEQWAVRENLARVKAWLDLRWQAKPKFLGPEIPLD